MKREIVVPDENTYLLKLPDNYVGKSLEVIAFEINEPYLSAEVNDKEQRLKKRKEITRNSLVDLSNFTFNRDEANNYG